MRLTKFPSAVAGRPLRQRGAWPRILKRSLVAAAILGVVLIVALGIGVAVILSGPTEIGMVRDRISAALQSTLGEDYAVSVGRAVIDVDPALGLVVEIDDVEVSDDQKVVVASVPATRLAIDPFALLRFRVAVSNVELSGAKIALVRAADGAVYLGNAATAHSVEAKRAKSRPKADADGADGGFPELYAAMRVMNRSLDRSLDAAIRQGFLHLSFVGGTIDIWDAAFAQERRFPSTDLTLSVDPATGDAEANLATSGHAGRWTATFERTMDQATGGRVLSGVFSQLGLADVFPRLAERGSLVDADIPLYGRASVAFAAGGAITDATLRLDVGAGAITFGELRETRETVILDEATVKVRWDIANKVILVEPSPFFFGETRGVVTGTIRPEADPAARRYAFEFETRGAVLAARDAGVPPLVAERIAVSGLADMPGKLVTFDSFTMSTPLGSLSAAGSLGFEGKTPSLAMAASVSPMPAAALKQMWTPFIAPGARRWVVQHVIDGEIASGRFEAAIPPGILWNRERPLMPDGAMRLDLRLENVSFTTFGALPPIINASGNAVLAGPTFGVDMEKGDIRLPSGATVAVNAGAFAIDNVFRRSNEGRIEVELSGDAKALGEIADAKPLLVLQRRNVTPDDLSGKADATVSVRLPLRPGISEADVDWKVTIEGTDLASKAPIEGRVFSDADVLIEVTPEEVAVKGNAKIDGVAADVSLTQPISLHGKSAGPGQQVARMVLDAAARKRLGIGLDEILGGTVSALISNVGGGGPGQHYDLDLKQARLVIPGVGWSKGVGVPARLNFDLKPAEDGFLVDKIVLEGDGFGFTGTARLDKNHSLVSADIDQLSLRPGDSVAVKLTATKAGYAINARGASFDARGVISHLKGTDESGDTADISVEASVDRLVGFNKQIMAKTKLAFASVRGTTRNLVLSGSIEGSGVSLAYTDSDAGASLDMNAADAGKVFRFVDLYARLDGGALNITGGREGPSGGVSGTFELTGFNILNEPAMERVVSTAAPGPGSTPKGVNPKQMHFERMVAQFRMTDDAISIDDALIRSAAVGATFNGRIDLGKSRVSINGTYIPAYAFNNALSRVPLIGLVLTGDFKEGLIGVTFKVEGPIDGPRVLINPLSAVAPGIFRKIFEFR